MIALLETEKDPAPDREDKKNLCYPALLISRDCAFCPPAKNLWSKIADELGIDLPVIVAEEDAETVRNYGAAGYPCLACGPGEYHYGLHFSHDQAKKILAGDGG